MNGLEKPLDDLRLTGEKPYDYEVSVLDKQFNSTNVCPRCLPNFQRWNFGMQGEHPNWRVTEAIITGRS